jgi:hypothetical protein
LRNLSTLSSVRCPGNHDVQGRVQAKPPRGFHGQQGYFVQFSVQRAWRPRPGSKINHRTLTLDIIDSRDSLAAKARPR